MEIEEIKEKLFSKNAKILGPLVGGMMNQSFIVQDGEEKYVMYISTEQANEMVDRALEKKHMLLANSLGISNECKGFIVEKGIKATKYIEGNSIDKVNEFDYEKVAELLRKLHSSETLSPQDYLPFERFKGYESEANEFVKESDPEYIVLRTALMENKEYLESQKKVLSHNDAQRSNIVKGDDGRYYLIDYEFCGNNDEIYDIACFGNGEVEEGYKLLEVYFKNPTRDQKLRYYLWRIYVSLQWYNVALVKHYRGEGKVHGFDFLQVASHFLDNAKTAYNGYKSLK